MKGKVRKICTRASAIAVMLVFALSMSACNITQKVGTQQVDTYPKDVVQAPSAEPRAIGKPVRQANHSDYDDIIADYWDIFYADWEERLTSDDMWDMGYPESLLYLGAEDIERFGYYIKDVNNDGIDELFLGINKPEGTSTFYQAFTMLDGKPYSFFAINEIDTLFLRSDGTVLNERVDMDGNQWCAVYSINGQTGCALEEGISDSGGSCRLFDSNSYDSKISREKFGQKLQSYYRNIVPVKYELFSHMLSRSRAIEDDQNLNDTVERISGNDKSSDVIAIPAQTQEYVDVPQQALSTHPVQQMQQVQQPQGQRYTHTILYDTQSTMVPTASVLVPYGWNASLTVDWTFMSTSSPGVAIVDMQGPDGSAIIMISNQAFVDNTVNGARVAEGQDAGLYCTTKHYLSAQAMQESSLMSVGFSNLEWIEPLEVPYSWTEMIMEAAQVKAQTLANQGMYVRDNEGSVAFNHYNDNQTEIAAMTMVMGVATSVSTSRVQLDSTLWCVPVQFWFIAPNEAAYQENFDTFLTVMGNSDFTFDFLYLCLKIGNAIDDGIHSGLMQQAYEYINANTGSWLDEYQSSSGYDSSKWANEWSDVIKDQQLYATEDGGAVKVDTKYDAVYQNGNELYLGTDGGAPYGWTKLYPTNY